jgi:hypothetical protein
MSFQISLLHASCMIYRGGKPHMVVDYRALNSVMIADRYPLPRIPESLIMLSGAKYISALDSMKGFYQIPIDPASLAFMAFASHRGLFEYSRMLFGLKNALPHSKGQWTMCL